MLSTFSGFVALAIIGLCSYVIDSKFIERVIRRADPIPLRFETPYNLPNSEIIGFFLEEVKSTNNDSLPRPALCGAFFSFA